MNEHASLIMKVILMFVKDVLIKSVHPHNRRDYQVAFYLEDGKDL